MHIAISTEQLNISKVVELKVMFLFDLTFSSQIYYPTLLYLVNTVKSPQALVAPLPHPSNPTFRVFALKKKPAEKTIRKLFGSSHPNIKPHPSPQDNHTCRELWTLHSGIALITDGQT